MQHIDFILERFVESCYENFGVGLGFVISALVIAACMYTIGITIAYILFSKTTKKFFQWIIKIYKNLNFG